jgi:acyl transferase domain-containing protein
LADAAALVAARGRLMQALPTGGAMAAVAADQAEVLPLLGDGVTIAAVNARNSVVVSGGEVGVTAVTDTLARQGRRVQRLAVSHAFHSPLMEPMLDEFARIAAKVMARQPRIPLVSNVTAQLAGTGYGSAQYWVDHVREPVRFADSVQLLEAKGATRFVEAGPWAGLVAAIEGSLSTTTATVVSVLNKDRPEVASVLSAAGRLFTSGVKVDWSAVFGDCGARTVPLPTYAFQRQRFWLQSGMVGRAKSAPPEDFGTPQPAVCGVDDVPPHTALIQSLQGLTVAQQHDLLTELVCAQVAGVLGHSVADVDPHQPFQELGLQSLSAIELRNRLKTATGLDLSPTLVFEYPTPSALAGRFVTELGGTGASGRALDEMLDMCESMLPSVDVSERPRVASHLRRLLDQVTDGS